MKIHNIDATGSFTYNGVDLSNLTGSTSDSGSFSTQILNLNQVSSSLNSFTSSINTTIKSKLDSESVISGSIQVSITGTTGYSTFSSSVSSSIGSLSGSVATTTSGLSSSIGSLSSSVATTTSDLSSSVGSLSSSVATTTGNLSSRIGSVETKTGSYATTGSNIFVGSQVITGSLYITNDMVVQGCSCLQNITASAVSIGTNTVILNTATPAVRFAGVSVQDSGSNDGVTGSIYWDGLCNRWIYSNPSGIGYSGGMLLSGPRTSTLGSESPLTCNYLAKSGGGDHLYDSCIIDDGTTTCVKNNFISTGTGLFSGQLCTITGVFGSKGGGNYGVLISDNDQSNVRLRFTNSGTGGQSMSIVVGNPGLSNSGLAFYDETNTCTRMYIGSNGNIGINSGNPLSKVYISHGGNNPVGCAGDFCIDAVVLEGGGGRSAIRSIQHDAGNQPAAGDLQFLNFLYNGSTYNWYERMRIRANGNVGINTCTPSNLLHIQASNNTTNQFRVDSCDGANACLRSYTTSDGAGLIINHYYAVGGSPYLRTSDFVSNQGDGASTQMRFFTKDLNVNAALAMIITSGRCVGINTNNPQSILDVQNCINSSYDPTNTLISNQWIRTSNPSTTACATSGIMFVAQGPGGGNGIATINGVTTSCGSMAITFGTRDASGSISEKLRIASGGNVGIGTTLPGLNLSAQGLYGLPNTSGTQTVGIFRVQDSASNIALDMGVVQNVATWIQSGNKANSEVLPLTLNPSGGNVGIGVTPSVWRSSERALQIGPTTTLYDVFGITILGNNFYTNTSSQSIYSTCGYASYYWQNTSDGSHVWTTAPSAAAGSVISFCERMRITCGGTIGIGTTTPKTYSSLTTQGQLISLNNIGIDYGQSFRLNNYYNSGTGTDRTISSGYAASIGLNQTSGAISFQMSTTCAAADNNVTTTSRMHISNCGHIVVNNAPNGQADYGRFTISTSTPKTSDPSTQEKTVLHLSTCETDTPFGLKFQIIGGSCDCTRAVAMQTGDHYISNQGNIVMQVAGGRVGIGIDNPEYKLHVCSPQSLLKLSSSTASFGSPGINLLQGAIDTVITATNTGLEVGTWSNHPIIFRTIQQERVRISNGGLTVCGTIVNSATAGNENYTLDTMNAYQSIANGGFVDFGGMSGMILVNNWLNGGVTLYLVGGGNTAALGSVVNVVGTMHHSAGVGGYRWCNNYGSTANFGFQVFRTRNTA